jgi:hypothetical protein
VISGGALLDMNVIGLEYALDLYTVNAGIAERAY